MSGILATKKMIDNILNGTTVPTRANTASYADRATNDSQGNNIANTYTKENGTYPSMTVGNATVQQEMITAIESCSTLIHSANGGFSAGTNAGVTGSGAIIGKNADASPSSSGASIGMGAYSNDGAGIGKYAVATGVNAVQLGQGTNANDNTLQFLIYQICDANGNIPAERLKSALLDLIFPVGSIYMNYANSSSPASTLGGSWKRIYNKFLIGAGSSYKIGSEGGEVSHLLTVNEMPPHSHNIVNSKNSKTGSAYMPIQVSSSAWGLVSQNGTGWIAQDTGYIAETGGNSPHNNMPPYRAVWMWRRTA